MSFRYSANSSVRDGYSLNHTVNLQMATVKSFLTVFKCVCVFGGAF